MDNLKKIENLVRDGKPSTSKIYYLKILLKNNQITAEEIINLVIDGQTFLMYAIKQGHYETVEFLIEYCKVDIEQTGSVSFDGEIIEGAPALWAACASGHFDIVKLLIKHGANINATTKTKSSPLRAACYDNHLDIVKYLVENGADIELTNRHGHTCLMIACFKGNYEIVKYLIEEGADVNRRSIKGNTALHDCAESGSVSIMILLLQNNAVMMPDSYNITPLLTAALNASESIIRLIIHYDSDDNGKRKSLCSDIEKINALELMGSTFLDKKRDICKAIHYWKLGLHLRQENIKRILFAKDPNSYETVDTYKKKVVKPNVAFNFAKEFETFDELDQLLNNVDDIRMQALLIRTRVLGKKNLENIYFIRYRGAVYADSGDFDRCIKLWMYALEMQQSSLPYLSPLTQSSLFSFAELFHFMMSNKSELVYFEEIFSVFQKALFELKSAILALPNKKRKYIYKKLKENVSNLVVNLDDFRNEENIESDSSEFNNENVNLNNLSNNEILKNIANNVDDTLVINNDTLDNFKNDLETIHFHRILIILQLFIGLLCRLKPTITDNQLFQLKKSIYQLIKLNPKGKNGFTPLHLACYKDETCQFIKFPISEMPMLDIVKLFIEVGADVNAVDNDLNTPLHILTQNKPNNSIIKVLIEKGAHLDVKNNKKQTPLDLLKKNSTFLNDYPSYSMKHLTLQCLCAQIIAKKNLSYKHYISRQMTDFVKIH